MRLHHSLILITSPQNPPMNPGMQGFDAPIHHFWETREISHFGGRNACLGQCIESPASREKRDATGVKRACKLDQSGFVRDAE
jgi:hypothetical protein